MSKKKLLEMNEFSEMITFEAGMKIKVSSDAPKDENLIEFV